MVETSPVLHSVFILYGLLLLYLYPNELPLVIISLAIIIQHGALIFPNGRGCIPRYVVIVGAAIGLFYGVYLKEPVVYIPMGYSLISKFGIFNLENYIH